METFVVDILRSDAEKMIQRMSWSRYTFSASISDIFIFFEYFFFFWVRFTWYESNQFSTPDRNASLCPLLFRIYESTYIYYYIPIPKLIDYYSFFRFSFFLLLLLPLPLLELSFYFTNYSNFFRFIPPAFAYEQKKCVFVVLFGDCCDCALVVVAVVEANKVHTYLTHTRNTRFDYSKCSNVCVCDIAFVGSDRWYFSCYSWRFVSASHTHSRLAEKVNRMHFSANVIAIRLLCTVGVYSISWGLCLCLAIAHAIQQKHSLQGDE